MTAKIFRHAQEGMVAAALGLVIYAVVSAFARPTPLYHSAVSFYIIYWSSLAAVVHLIVHRRPVVLQRGQHIWPLYLVICIVVSSMLADDQFAAWARFRLYFSVVLFAGVAYLWFRSSGERISPLVLAVIACVHCAILLLVLMGSVNANPARLLDMSWVPYHAHIRHVAYHGMIAACAGTSLYLIGGPLRLLGLVVATVALFGIAYFGARGALLGWGIFAVLITYFAERRARVLVLCISMLLVAWAFAGYVNEHLRASPFTGSLTARMESIASTTSSTGRTKIWLDALRASLNHPFLGHGPEGYLSSRCCLNGSVQPHNSIVQMQIEFGLMGLIGALALFFRYLWRPLVVSVKERVRGPVNIRQSSLLATLIGIFGFSLIDGLFYHVVPLLLSATLFVLFQAGRTEKMSQSHEAARQSSDMAA